MSGNIIRVVTPSAHHPDVDVVDDYLVNERDGDAALRILLASGELAEGAEPTVLPSDLHGSSFNNAGVVKGGFLKLDSRREPRGAPRG